MNIQYGDWTVVRKIGSGSFGTVYEIERESFGFRQKAALKVISIPQSQTDVVSIRSTGMDEASIGDYYRDLASEIVKELQTMERLKGHTNIVSYEDHEIHPKSDGVGWEIYIRMELLTPLMKHLAEHQMSREEIIRLGIDLCRALERCEALNIIHRDIKPDNIFLSKLGDGKLGDFGIARTVERTMSGMSKKGTYSFMAPEVYMGQPYGKTVDIYSLGLVLYRLLNYNRGPFLPSYPQPIRFRDQEQSLVRRMKGEALSAPAQADERLAEIVLRACSFDSSQRFSTAQEMRLALGRALEQAADIVEPPLSSLSPLQPEDTGDGTICEWRGVPEHEIQSSTVLENNTADEVLPEPEESLPHGYQEYQDEGTVSAFGFGDRVEPKHKIASNKMADRSDYAPGEEGTVSIFAQKGRPLQDSRLSTEMKDEGTVSFFGQPTAANQQKKQETNNKLCKIQFRDGYGNTISEVELSRGEPIVPPIVKNPRFNGWKPNIPPQARWDEVFVAQYKLHGVEQNNSRYVERIKITYLDEDGEYLDSRCYSKGAEVKHPYISKVFQKKGRVFRGWEPDVKRAVHTTVCRACYDNANTPKKRRILGYQL